MYNYNNMYPDIDDPNFNKKIVLKKEFFIHKSKEDSKKIEEENHSFILTSMQQILKNFIHPKTPYNGVLVYHGTGVGKTCTSITIAEQFKNIVQAKDKKILVVLSPSLRKNFIKQLFDIHKVIFKYKGSEIVGYESKQCSDYLKDIDMHGLTIEDIDKKVRKLIQKYYQFFGYTELSNYIERLIVYSTKGIIDPKKKIEKRAEILKNYFSDRVIIMDEIHSIRSIDNDAVDTSLILEMIQNAINNKLILLTATPIYNDPKEIIFILNLLLANDKRPLLTPDMIFDRFNNITDDGTKILIEHTRGYISYLKGANPLYFPIKIYPTDKNLIKDDEFPKYDIKGNKILRHDILRDFKIINCFMHKDYQYKYYKLGLDKYKKINNDNVTDQNNTNTNQDDKNQDDLNSNQDDSNSGDDIKLKNIKMNIQISNIVFPSDDTNTLNYGKKGFLKYFEQSHNGKSFKIRKDMMEKYGNILSEKTLQLYSTKMATLLEYIKNARGIVYIYSDYIWSGVLPLALILEYNGYIKYGDTQLFEGDKLPQRTIHKGSKITAKYILLSGNTQISPNNDKEIDICTRDNNLEGETVKIILGSPLAGEGIDLKRIREVHILDPWYHDKKLEQIIGRAVRYKSHYKLSEKYRNVTIYQYAANIPKSTPEYKKGIESLDLRVYRIAENKGFKVKSVENILKSNAFDCNLNLYENTLHITDEISITTSQNKNIKYIDDKERDINDNYSCYPNIDFNKIVKDDINIDTYNTSYSIYDKNNIIKLFNDSIYLSLQQILEKLQIKDIDTIYKDDIFTILNTFIKEKTIFNTQYGKGYLIYADTYYIFTPEDINNTKLPINYRNTRIFKKLYGPKNIDIHTIYKIESEKQQKHDKQIDNKQKDNKQTEIIEKKADKAVQLLYTLKKNVNEHKENMKKYIHELYEIEFDILNYEEQKVILDYLLHKDSETYTETETILFNAIKDEYILYTKYIDEKIKTNEIYGYMILNKDNIIEYYHANNKIGDLIKQKIIKNKYEFLNKKQNDIFGYTIYDKKKNKKLFKIIDNRNVKVEEIKIKKAEKTGFICIAASNFKIEDARDIINKIDSNILTDNSKKQNKNNLCYIIEVLLRYSNNHLLIIIINKFYIFTFIFFI